MNKLTVLIILGSGYAFASEQVKLEGVTLKLEDPIEVSSTVGRAWFPTFAKFKTGELMALYALTEDSNAAVTRQAGFQISRDEGKTWGFRWDIFPEFGSTILFPQNDGSMLVIPHLLHMDGASGRSFHGIYTRIEQGGKRVLMEPGGLKVVDWPWEVNENESKVPRSNWTLSIRFDGNAIAVGNRLIAPIFGRKKGERMSRLNAGTSEDGGRTWKYLSEIAGPDVLGDRNNQKEAEGPSENGLIRLANGDLMIVYRTGNRGWHIGRSYSSDNGRTWSQSDMLPAKGVEPSIVRASNGIIALTTGRPGLWLWISTDDVGRSWQRFDLLDYHNRWAPGPTHRISMQAEKGERSIDQSTAYTEIIEVSPNRLLFIYDRTALGWQATPKDSGEVNRIYVLPIELARDR